MRTDEMPAYLPDLKPDDFVIGPKRKGYRYCLVGWCDKLQISSAYGSPSSPLSQAVDAVDPHAPRNKELHSWGRPNTLANRRLAAKAWAVLIKELGYVHDVGTMTLP